ncbi:MAG: NUDIX hydrolase [Hyphomicrobium sp.]|nr:MAG: NUDIX hydrolase [Hyphomicrobium sp.]PPD01745.1 MAG: NUDIX hydrolase [Hyphomicrobium sp.]
MTLTPTDPEPEESSVAIRDAACVVVVDKTGGEARLLMGRRHANQIFLPDKWVFPGGRVDPIDEQTATSEHNSAPDVTAGLPDYLKPFARAAVRELREETGLSLHPNVASTDLATAPLLPLARAITPPGRIRRYDTWFFMAQRQSFQDTLGSTDDELLDLAWFAIGEARRLDIPNITRLVLEDATTWIAGETPRFPKEIPFYYQDGQGFKRTMLACDQSALPP